MLCFIESGRYFYLGGVLNTHLPWITFTEDDLCCLQLYLIFIEQMASQIDFIDHDFEERCRRNGVNCSCQPNRRLIAKVKKRILTGFSSIDSPEIKRHQYIGFYLLNKERGQQCEAELVNSHTQGNKKRWDRRENRAGHRNKLP
jgi:hypothetical protein